MQTTIIRGLRRLSARSRCTAIQSLARSRVARTMATTVEEDYDAGESVIEQAFRPTDEFAPRHIGPRATDVEEMLKAIGKYPTLDALIDATVPAAIRRQESLQLLPALTESQALQQMQSFADMNTSTVSFIGAGYYDTIVPPVILRNILENPGWYTSYTPYQAEISQGRLESLLNFQTMICDLTGMHISNASLLDEATAAGEAMNMAINHHSGSKRMTFFVASDVHPQTLGVIQTRAHGLGITVKVGDLSSLDVNDPTLAGVLLQYPGTHGELNIPRIEEVVHKARQQGVMTIAASDLLALTLIKSPGDLGFDIAIGSAQRFGVPMGFGGPHAAYLATKEEHKRRMPGRIIGVSVDAQGNRALRMAMQTREQHIRRDKATSNICTAQALLANMAAMYSVYHGPDGLVRIASRVHDMTAAFAAVLRECGYRVHSAAGNSASAPEFFDTVLVSWDHHADPVETSIRIRTGAAENNILLRPVTSTSVAVSFDEAKTEMNLLNLLEVFVGYADAQKLLEAYCRQAFGSNSISSAVTAASFTSRTPLAPFSASVARSSPFLTHPVFNTHRSESQLLRYIHKLQSRDMSLTHSMISLGSCTMKLNATSELMPITWPKLANVHPFAPRETVEGYMELIESLSASLAEITNFAAVSLQPNSGAAGEYAGLMAIRAYHEARGEGHRDVCLIPVSAHGTNPASAVMAGYKVVVVASDAHGNVDFADLKAKAEANKDKLAALMITYPSTYGVFEEGVVDFVKLIHSHGGQVYMDGANMNAQVGLTSPGTIGADVCHLNLHKTFAIPHGGGGPGVGAIAVAAHLAPYLPGHPVSPTAGVGFDVRSKSDLAVSAAPYGSALILPISWMYIHMLGGEGLTQSTKTAILNANYLAARLKGHYPIAFLGRSGTCAHEFILDLRPLKARCNNAFSEEDVAKRLMDYGFHSPTMSWPVPGTLMIEPTESEDKGELDRFADALISIRAEIEDVITGKVDKVNNVLKNAPHTAAVVSSDKWTRPYPREQAAYPVGWVREHKFWPSVGRVDNVHGDRHLVCTCPPLSDYETPSSAK